MKLKIVFLSLIFVTSTNLNAQDSPLKYEQILEFENLDKNSLFVGLNEWIAISFNSANNVIQMADKEAGKFIVKGSDSYSTGRLLTNCYDGRIKFTLNIDVRENRTRIIMSNIFHETDGACEVGILTTSQEFQQRGISKKGATRIWLQMKKQAEDLFSTLISSINTSLQNESNDDW